MDDIYIKPLNSFQLNYISLMRLLPIRDICIKILKDKKFIEDIDTFNYHCDLWENHASRFYHCIDNDKKFHGYLRFYSFVHDDRTYITERDRTMDYFIYTGISYQVRNLLLDLLKHNRYYFENDIPGDEEIKMYVKEDDIKYSKLAKLIMRKCLLR